MGGEDEIYEALKQEKTSRDICQELIKKEKNAVGRDNITAVVIVHQPQVPSPLEGA